VADEVWMMENATYSILSPEGFASILWKDGKRAKEASGMMKLTAEDLKELGIIEEIISEPEAAGPENVSQIAASMKDKMKQFLKKQMKKTPEELVTMRYQRFRAM
jgi:acetyl-CoA carboxylase alpha subunit